MSLLPRKVAQHGKSLFEIHFGEKKDALAPIQGGTLFEIRPGEKENVTAPVHNDPAFGAVNWNPLGPDHLYTPGAAE